MENDSSIEGKGEGKGEGEGGGEFNPYILQSPTHLGYPCQSACKTITYKWVLL